MTKYISTTTQPSLTTSQFDSARFDRVCNPAINMSQGYFGDRKFLYLDNLFWGLITSSHILHKHNIFDAYGHVSVRNPDNPATFFLPSNNPPALLSSAEDLIEYRVEDGNPTEDTTKAHFAERFIHSETYKRYPGVNAVIHSHCHDVLPFCITDVPLKPAIHTAGFLGANGAPVWDIQNAYSSSDKQRDLLVRNTDQGHNLAVAFRPETSSGFVYDKMRAALPSALTSSGVLPANKAKQDGMPQHFVVLMRGHGFTTCAESLEAAVYQAIYTKEAAAVQTLASSLLAADASQQTGGTVEGSVHVGGNHKIQSGKIKLDNASQQTSGTVAGSVNVDENHKIQNGKIKMDKAKEIMFLSDKETAESLQFARATMLRPWALWTREVEVDPLYQNQVERKETETL
jgi:ribulose-5-phosphate 4-epimerase/fuculose-1-phosphate aldolase